MKRGGQDVRVRHTPTRDRPDAAGSVLGLTAPEVRCVDLRVELDFEDVLRGVDLTVPAGTTTALIGASGSGKTTLMRHVLGLLPPDSGSVTIGGRDVWTADPDQLREVRRNLSALHGGATVYEGSILGSVTLRENVLTRLHEKHSNPSVAAGGSATKVNNNPYVRLWTELLPHVEAIPELAARAQAWLERFDLAEVADLLPHQASAGQRRRAALAACLAADAPLYVIDDPDGALDRHNREVVTAAIGEAAARNGATMLLATHDLTLARALSDQVAVLADGRIAFHGDPEEALADVERWYRVGHDGITRSRGPGSAAPRARVPAARTPEPAGDPATARSTERAPAVPAPSPEPAPGMAKRIAVTVALCAAVACFVAVLLVALLLP